MRKEKRTEFQLFNGYVVEPLPLVMLTVFVGLGLLWISLYATYDFLFPKEPLGRESTLIKLTNYELDGPIVVFNYDDMHYSIPSSTIEHTVLDHLIQSTSEVRIIYEKTDEGNDKKHSIKAMWTEDGLLSISESDVLSAEKINENRALATLWSFSFIYWITCFFAYYILCNAPRYPRLAAFFIRKGYRNF